MNRAIRVCRDDPAFVAAAAALFVDSAAEAMSDRGRFVVALSGGSTPRRVFERLAQDADTRARVAWPRVEWWWGDERHVPPDDPDSNYRMASESLLLHVPIDPAKVHRLKGEYPDADAAAREYDADLRRTYGGRDGDPPRFDLVLLGLGPDGHTASLFPGTTALAERDRFVVANDVPALRTTRLTLTLPVINAARRVAFLVAGEDKATVLARVIDGPADQLPAQAILPADGEVIWLVDQAAAQHLSAVT
jgi:6-phosphogluconolactonase